MGRSGKEDIESQLGGRGGASTGGRFLELCLDSFFFLSSWKTVPNMVHIFFFFLAVYFDHFPFKTFYVVGNL